MPAPLQAIPPLCLPEPPRLRLPDGRVPPLTAAQRARIITIDLDNPPDFVRIARHSRDLTEIAHGLTPQTSVWLLRPDWDKADGIFDRRERSDCSDLGQRKDIGYDFAEYRRDGQRYAAIGHRSSRRETVASLNAPSARAFLANLTAICRGVQRRTEARSLHISMVFKTYAGEARDTDVHCDGSTEARKPGFRAFCAAEHGNLLFPDVAQARALGFRFNHDVNGVSNNAHVVDLIESGVRFYTPPLRTIAFFRNRDLVSGKRRLGPAPWHAAWEIAPDRRYLRPCAVANFIL